MRNPSPPPLNKEENALLRGDCIGDTVFSKKSILTLLMKLYKHDVSIIYCLTEDVKNNLEDIPTETILELEKDFEDEMCSLWDMCSNEQVALYLEENNCKPIFFDILKQTYSPRLMEIILGIFGNLVCVIEIRSKYNIDVEFRKSLVGYLHVTDAPCLVELTRIIIACIVDANSIKNWIETMGDSFSTLVNMVKNSLNETLIGNVLEIMDIMFDADESLLDKNITQELITSLTDCLPILEKQTIKAWVHIIQLISTNNKGQVTLGENNTILEKLQLSLSHIDKFELIQNINVIVSVVSIVTTLLQNDSSKVFIFLNKNISIVQLIIESLKNIITKDLIDRYGVYLEFYFDLFKCILAKISDWLIEDHVTNKFEKIQQNIKTIDQSILNNILEYCQLNENSDICKSLKISVESFQSSYENLFLKFV